MTKLTHLNAFKLALATHAIRTEFEFNIHKNEPWRYRAYCSGRAEGCRWRIHASTMGDNTTVKVKGLAHVGLGKYLDYLDSLLLSSLQGLVEGKLKIMWTTSIQLKSSEQHMRASSLLYLTWPCGPNLTMDFSCIHLY